jgi:putative transposase
VHAVAAERTFFVTSSTWGKRSLLQAERTAALLIDVLYDYRRQGKFWLHEFVIMPDHFHLLLSVDSDTTVEKAVQFIKGGFAFRAGRELGLHAPVWQKGFSEVRVNDSGAFANMRAYIHENPVKRFLSVTSTEYPYSSASLRLDLDPPPQRLKALSREDAFGIAKAIP